MFGIRVLCSTIVCREIVPYGVVPISVPCLDLLYCIAVAIPCDPSLLGRMNFGVHAGVPCRIPNYDIQGVLPTGVVLISVPLLELSLCVVLAIQSGSALIGRRLFDIRVLCSTMSIALAIGWRIVRVCSTAKWKFTVPVICSGIRL